MAYIYDFLKKLVLPFHYYRKALENIVFKGQKKRGGDIFQRQIILVWIPASTYTTSYIAMGLTL